MPILRARIVFVGAVIAISALLATPLVAAADTAPGDSPMPTPANLGDDMIFVPGADTVAPKSLLKKDASLDVGIGIGVGATSVEKVWVSVADVTSKTTDTVNSGMTQAKVQTLISQINSYWSAESAGAVSVVFGGYETRSLGKSSCDPNAVLSAEEDAAFGGKFNNNAWLHTHTHLMVLTTEACNSSSFATVGGQGGEIFSGNGLSTTLGMPYLLHEFGHNLGFLHADASICTNTTSYDGTAASFGFTSSVCPTTEYDDYLDIMGYTVKDATPNLSSVQQILAGWLKSYATVTDASPKTTILLGSLTGLLSLVRAIKIIDPKSGDAYYVEYRTNQGRDATSAEFRYSRQCNPTVHGYTACQLDSDHTAGSVRILRALPMPASGGIGTTVLATGLIPGSTDKTRRHTHQNVGDTFTAIDGGFSLKVNSTSPLLGASVTVSFVKPVATTTALTLDHTTRNYAAPATRATATVATATVGTPAGTVGFYDGKTKLASVHTAANGTASYALSTALAVGTHSLTASFTPDATTLSGSSSPAATLTVAKAVSTTAYTLSKSIIHQKDQVKLAVVTKAPGISAPTGTLRIYSNGKEIASHSLASSNKGKLTFTLPKFGSTGKKSIVVKFGGSTTVSGSTSAARIVTVGK